METHMTGKWALVLTVALALAGFGFAEDIPWGKDTAAPALPAIFNGRGGDRLAAEEVARQDAYRKLVERVYGLALDNQTDVQDLALASRTVDTSFRNELRGMKEVDKKYFDDGRVEIAMKITLREVVEVLERTYKQVAQNDRLVSDQIIENIARENRDKDLTVVGRGALKDSPGLDKIRAMRAAEADCYARLAGRIFGMQISANTTVRDFALESDRIRSKVVVSLLNGMKFTKYEFKDDGTAEATGQITIREVVEVLTRIYRRYGEGSKVKIEDIQNTERKNRDTIITEVGYGVVRERPTADSVAVSAAQSQEPFFEQKTVIERVLSKGIVVE